MNLHADHIADLLDRVAALDDAPDRHHHEWFYADLARIAEDIYADVAGVAREHGYRAGHEDGYHQGHADGYQRGLADGRRNGHIDPDGTAAPRRSPATVNRHTSARPTRNGRGRIA